MDLFLTRATLTITTSSTTIAATPKIKLVGVLDGGILEVLLLELVTTLLVLVLLLVLELELLVIVVDVPL